MIRNLSLILDEITRDYILEADQMNTQFKEGSEILESFLLVTLKHVNHFIPQNLKKAQKEVAWKLSLRFKNDSCSSGFQFKRRYL